MNKALLVVLAVAALAATGFLVVKHLHKTPKAVSSVQVPTPVYDMWVHWKNTHNKKYTPEEEQQKLAVFYQNYLKIQNHNQKNGVTYTLGPNRFMDMTAEEFKAVYLSTHVKTSSNPVVMLSVENLGSAVDWTTKGAVTPVKDQAQCGSCWAFSTTGALEGAHFLSAGSLLSFSEQNLVDCSGSYGNEGCNGGLMDQAFSYVKDHGIALESAYPYKGVDQTCKSFTSAWKISGFTDVAAGDAAQLKSAVNGRPVAIAVDANNWQFYNGGVFSDCETSLDHGVLLVGYDDAGNWKVKNSWGTSWGESGFIRLAPGNTCGLANAASYPNA